MGEPSGAAGPGGDLHGSAQVVQALQLEGVLEPGLHLLMRQPETGRERPSSMVRKLGNRRGIRKIHRSVAERPKAPRKVGDMDTLEPHVGYGRVSLASAYLPDVGRLVHSRAGLWPAGVRPLKQDAVNQLASNWSRSSSREVSIRVPFIFVVYFSRGTLPPKRNGVRKGT